MYNRFVNEWDGIFYAISLSLGGMVSVTSLKIWWKADTEKPAEAEKMGLKYFPPGEGKDIPPPWLTDPLVQGPHLWLAQGFRIGGLEPFGPGLPSLKGRKRTLSTSPNGLPCEIEQSQLLD